jgi:hypothetical protein
MEVKNEQDWSRMLKMILIELALHYLKNEESHQ